MSTKELSEQEIQRRESLKKLREIGINPYPAELFPVTDFAKPLIQEYKEEKDKYKFYKTIFFKSIVSSSTFTI